MTDNYYNSEYAHDKYKVLILITKSCSWRLLNGRREVQKRAMDRMLNVNFLWSKCGSWKNLNVNVREKKESHGR